jgi:putative peptidoglycan lipid II flippase
MSEREKLFRAVGIITIANIAARILGYVREALLYYLFGQTRIADIFNAAFSIPDFIYMILVGGALSSAFIPVFGAYITKKISEPRVLPLKPPKLQQLQLLPVFPF